MSKFPPGQSGNPNGRPKGAQNRRTVELQDAMADAARKISEAMGLDAEVDAHALLTAVYRNPGLPIDLRVDAAKASIKFEKPALSSVEQTSDVQVQWAISSEPLTVDEWTAEYGVAPAGGASESAG